MMAQPTALGPRVRKWSTPEIDVACIALNHAQKQGGPEANPDSLEFFTEGFLRRALKEIRPKFTQAGQLVIDRIEHRLRIGQ